MLHVNTCTLCCMHNEINSVSLDQATPVEIKALTFLTTVNRLKFVLSIVL